MCMCENENVYECVDADSVCVCVCVCVYVRHCVYVHERSFLSVKFRFVWLTATQTFHCIIHCHLSLCFVVGVYFLVESDIKEWSNLQMSKETRTVLTVLRHCGRLYEIRGDGHVRYAMIEMYWAKEMYMYKTQREAMFAMPCCERCSFLLSHATCQGLPPYI